MVEPPAIQIVEDDPVIARDLHDALNGLGYFALEPVSDVASALLAVKRERPAVALLDIKLAEGQDGIELGTVLRARYNLALIFVTSYGCRSTVDRAVRIKPDGYLLKPASSDALYAAIETALLREPRTTLAESGSVSGLPSARLKRVLSHIEGHIGENLTLSELAELVGMSPDHFGRTFRASMGMTPHRFLVVRRMARARRLLETSDHSLHEVAAQCGYESQSYFTTVFRNEIGTTPAAYRRAAWTSL